MAHSWSSNGNQAMFILHVLRKSPGGTQRQSPLEETTTLVGYVLSMSSSALRKYTRRKHYKHSYKAAYGLK